MSRNILQKNKNAAAAMCLALCLLLSGGCGNTGENVSAPSAESAATVPEETVGAESGAASAADESAETSDTDETTDAGPVEAPSDDPETGLPFNLAEVPDWSGKPSYDINGDVPFFADDELTTEPFESYSELDELGRCGVAYACVGPETMPTEGRESISEVKPTGWHSVRYDGIDGDYLYNRCHLIGFQLTGENANERNLITGTRYMNVQGMEEFERSVAMYIDTTGYHVMYRVTPVFEGNNLVASGVLMEAKSVEDRAIQYCAYCYNVQPGVTIDYATGESTGPEYTGSEETDGTGVDASGAASSGSSAESASEGTGAGTFDEGSSEKDGSPAEYEDPNQDANYIVNTNTGKFHLPTCPSAKQTKPKNRMDWFGTREELIEAGYEPCKVCNP